jgi:hypothetical protein
MSVDLKSQELLPILIGSNGQSKIFLKSIHVSQLTQTQKTKIKEGVLTMVTKQSNNVIPKATPRKEQHCKRRSEGRAGER